MRLEATVPDHRGKVIDQIADEMGTSRSQIVDEALSLFVKAFLEVRQGRRVVILRSDSSEPTCELATPTLTALEWAANPQRLELSPKALEKMRSLVADAPKPSARLRAAAKRHKK